LPLASVSSKGNDLHVYEVDCAGSKCTCSSLKDPVLSPLHIQFQKVNVGNTRFTEEYVKCGKSASHLSRGFQKVSSPNVNALHMRQMSNFASQNSERFRESGTVPVGWTLPGRIS